ncbi:MAG: hypothetical protein ACR2PU_00045 [Gammaproteobacteria bacterium]
MVVLLVGFLIYIAWLNYTKVPLELSGTPLREYQLMDNDKQKLVILESRRTLFHEYLNKNKIEHANCVARLFDANIEQGKKEMEEAEIRLDSEADRDQDQLVEEITINFINTKYCRQ